jgi:trigger factor
VTNQTQEFKNDNIHVTVTREPGSKVKLAIQVSPIAAQAAYKMAIKNVNKEVSMPGFRKGKAPDNYVEQNYKSHVNDEWQSLLLNTSFQEALDLIKIYPLGKNSVQRPQIKDVSKENGAKISLEFETAPEIPEIDLSSLSIKKIQPKEIGQKDRDDVVTQIKLSHAQWENVENQPIVEGDFVDLDIYNTDENFEICKDTRFAVEHGKIGDWLIKLLIGKKTGDVVEGLSENEHSADTCTDPSHDHSHDEDFKATNCRITVKNHQKAILPELDDELAKKAGAPDTAELMKRIDTSLQKREENRIKHLQIKELENQLKDLYVFDIPASITAQDKEARMQHAMHHLDVEKLSKDEAQKKIKDIEEKASQEIDEAYRLYFIFEKIAQDNQLAVSQEEIMQEFMNQMMSQQNAIINQNMQPEEIRSRLQSYLVSEKAKAYAVEKAKQID